MAYLQTVLHACLGAQLKTCPSATTGSNMCKGVVAAVQYHASCFNGGAPGICYLHPNCIAEASHQLAACCKKLHPNGIGRRSIGLQRWLFGIDNGEAGRKKSPRAQPPAARQCTPAAGTCRWLWWLEERGRRSPCYPARRSYRVVPPAPCCLTVPQKPPAPGQKLCRSSMQ